MWADWYGPGVAVARMYNLESSHPVISTKEQYPGYNINVFESCNRFYVWEQCSDGVYLVEHLAVLEDIIRAMKTNGFRGLELKPLKPCEDESCEE